MRNLRMTKAAGVAAVLCTALVPATAHASSGGLGTSTSPTVKGDKATVHLDETVLKGPNGLLVHDGALYVLDNNSLNRVEPDKSLKVLADGMPGGVDGLENVTGNDFLVSVWSGAVWYVNADGSKELLFDGKAVQTSTADIGWDPSTKTVYVPTFFKNSIIAFKVE